MKKKNNFKLMTALFVIQFTGIQFEFYFQFQRNQKNTNNNTNNNGYNDIGT